MAGNGHMFIILIGVLSANPTTCPLFSFLFSLASPCYHSFVCVLCHLVPPLFSVCQITPPVKCVDPNIMKWNLPKEETKP